MKYEIIIYTDARGRAPLREYLKELKRLDRKEWEDMSNKNLTWNELEAEIFTPEEIAESRARVEIIASIIDARQAKGLSQKELAEITGIKQPAIARLENGHISPSVDTINKLLAPLGKRLAVIDA